MIFHGLKLPESETAPRKKLYRKRIRKMDNILGHRFFSRDYGFFEVTKVWHCAEYRYTPVQYIDTSECTYWGTYYTIQIETEYGEKLILRKLALDLEGVFDRNYD